MLRLFGNHRPLSAFRRVMHLCSTIGPIRTFGIFLAVVDEQYLRLFDRRYGIRTSGYVDLSSTSIERSRLVDVTQYRPVSGWGLRKLLKRLALARDLHFVDLGCGLGRACVIAAEYGFSKVTGVELASELCAVARENAQSWQRKRGHSAAIAIVEMDALEFCTHTDADVFFMFRPFSWDFLNRVLLQLVERSRCREKSLTIIYSERMMLPGTYAHDISKLRGFQKTYEAGLFGQAFYIFKCDARLVETPAPANPRKFAACCDPQ